MAYHGPVFPGTDTIELLARRRVLKMQKYNDVSDNRENAKVPNNYKYSCPCNEKSTLARRPDRPPLAGIQGSNHAVNRAKSKSTSSCTRIPSPIKFLEHVKPREAIQTKMAGPPPVIKAPPKIKVRSVKSLNTKSIPPAVPKKPSPCRCLHYADSKTPTETVIDDVFLPPTSSTVISKQPKLGKQPSQTTKSTNSVITPDAASTVEFQPNSTKRIRKSTLDSYTSTVTLPPKPEAPNLSKISSISGFLNEAARMILETHPTDTAKFSKTPDFDSTILDKVTVKRDTSIVLDADQSLIDADFFFKDLDRGKPVGVETQSLFSPVKSNVPLRRCNSDVTIQKAHFKKPAVKTSLLKRRSSVLKRDIYFPLLYSPEYSEGIINYLYINKNNNLLENKWVSKYIAKRHRTDILNWLLEISEHYFPGFEAPYIMAVRLMDYAIVKLTLNSSQYQLAAITSLWIAGKFLEGDPRLSKASKLFALCSGKYSKIQILAMERHIIKTVNFCLNLPDPLDFLFQYLKLSNLENDEELILSSKFIIECASLFETYCSVTPSFLAASALYMALNVVKNKPEVYVYFLWYDSERLQQFIQHVLKINVQYALMSQYTPVRRYKEVAQLFFNI